MNKRRTLTGYKKTFDSGKYFEKRGNLEKAEKMYLKVLSEAPNDPYANLELAKIYIKQRKLNKAENILTSAISANPYDGYLKLELGKLYSRQRRFGLARKTLEESIELDKENIYAILELGKLDVKEEKFEEAEKSFLECIEKEGDDIPARMELARLYIKQRKIDKAEELFNQILQINPKDSLAKVEFARVYIEQGKFDEARKMLEERLQENPYDEKTLFQLQRIRKKIELSDFIKTNFSKLKDKTQVEAILKILEGTENKEKSQKSERIKICMQGQKNNDNIYIGNKDFNGFLSFEYNGGKIYILEKFIETKNKKRSISTQNETYLLSESGAYIASEVENGKLQVLLTGRGKGIKLQRTSLYNLKFLVCIDNEKIKTEKPSIGEI